MYEIETKDVEGMERCPGCGKRRFLTKTHHALGAICEACDRALDFNTCKAAVIGNLYEAGKTIHSKRGGSHAYENRTDRADHDSAV